ncbi:hypothetical protein Trydic_g23813 [Trypoxylus dichotomus]
MCGIFCIFATAANDNLFLEKCKLCDRYIKRRGPDYYSYCDIRVSDYRFIFSASVLWLQGENLVKQPMNNDRSTFVFNGDIFGGDISDQDRARHGDTLLLFKKFESSTSIVTTLLNIQGPYAFIYLDKKEMKLYFGRDIFGRRSLLVGKVNDGLLLASVLSKDVECIEIPAIGIFSYDLQSKKLELAPWNFKNNNFKVKLNELEKFLCCSIEIDEQLEIKTPKAFFKPDKLILEFVDSINLMPSDRIFERLLSDVRFFNNVKQLYYLLEDAVKRRISTQPKYCKNCITDKMLCTHALTGVLFSGGLDCTVLALLSDKYTDPQNSIDLINVAFQKGENYNTPDRKTGLESYEELKKLRPNRTWNFVEINITIGELEEQRKEHIRHLIHPLNSILDDSLGCALWFASRANTGDYETPARVLLVGMGADELFGGYTRHRAALKKNGWLGLHNSLNEDWQNISHRNLARDDRVVSDHGRQLRTPYLDENVVEFVRNLNCWEKTYPSDKFPAGVGDKILLRTLAYFLGLRGSTTFKKRALQFGSRIANNKENGHDVSPRL